MRSPCCIWEGYDAAVRSLYDLSCLSFIQERRTENKHIKAEDGWIKAAKQPLFRQTKRTKRRDLKPVVMPERPICSRNCFETFSIAVFAMYYFVTCVCVSGYPHVYALENLRTINRALVGCESAFHSTRNAWYAQTQGGNQGTLF